MFGINTIFEVGFLLTDKVNEFSDRVLPLEFQSRKVYVDFRMLLGRKPCKICYHASAVAIWELDIDVPYAEYQYFSLMFFGCFAFFVIFAGKEKRH